MPTQDCQPVIVVSGLPRSGTSLMMQMLRAGGLPVLSDDQRAPDEDNPRGYLELERIKNLRTDQRWLDEAPGKAVKIIHLLLMELPFDALAPGRYFVRFIVAQGDRREVREATIHLID